MVRDNQVMQYDVIVDQSPTSTSQKEETWAVMQQLLPVALKMGLPVPPELLDYMPIPSTLAQKWKEMIMHKEQQPEPQDQADAMKKMADADLSQSKAELNRAKVQSEGIKTANESRKADIEERRAENEAAETTSKIYERATL